MSTNTNDNEVIRRIKQGDQQAYAELVDRYQHLVFTIALRVMGNREDAKEVAQDTFVKAFRNLDSFRGDSKFATWLYAIANNSAISHLRTKKTFIRTADADMIGNVADHLLVNDKPNDAELKSRQAMVNHSINRLSPDDAQVITLFYKAEQSLEEIAEIMGIETNTVKVRLHRARVRLKEKMEQYFPEEVKDIH